MILRIRDWDRHFENSASRKLKRLDWVAVPNKMDGSGYTFLVDHPNGAAHLGAWYAIVEVASRREVRGTFPDPIGGNCRDIGGFCRSLGRISRLPWTIFQEVIPRLIEIGWVECIQQDTDTSAESATTSADSPNASGENGATGNGMEGNGKEEKHVAIATGLFPIPVDPEGTVRPDVPSPTFEDFWKVYWNLDGKKDAKKAWDQVVKKRGAQWLIDQAITYRQRFEETDKWKFKGNMLPGSWLRGERWNDQGGISTSNGNTPYRKDDWHG